MAGYLIYNTRPTHSCQSLVMSLLKMAVIVTPILRRIEKVDKYFNPGFGDQKKKKVMNVLNKQRLCLLCRASQMGKCGFQEEQHVLTSQRLCPPGGIRGQRAPLRRFSPWPKPDIYLLTTQYVEDRRHNQVIQSQTGSRGYCR